MLHLPRFIPSAIQGTTEAPRVFFLLIFLVHTKREREDTWGSRCRNCSCTHFLVWGQYARSGQMSQGSYILLEHYSLCHLPTHCLPCQFPGSQRNPFQKCWTEVTIGCLISSPSGESRTPTEWPVGRKKCCCPSLWLLACSAICPAEQWQYAQGLLALKAKPTKKLSTRGIESVEG